jgi:glutamate 5-kinase
MATGGMKTKIEAAEYCVKRGITVWIGNGRTVSLIELLKYLEKKWA